MNRKKSRSSKPKGLKGTKGKAQAKAPAKAQWGEFKKHRLRFDSEEFLVHAIPASS